MQADEDGNIMTTFSLENSGTVLYKTWFNEHADGYSQFDLPYMTFTHRPAGEEKWVNDLVVTSANLTQLMKNRMSVWGYVTQSYSSITNKATNYVALTGWANSGIERVDRMVHVHVLFKIIARIPDWQSFVFFTLPTNCRPYRGYNIQFGSSGSCHEYIQAFIESGGNVQLKGGSSIPVNTEFMLDTTFPSPSVSYDF